MTKTGRIRRLVPLISTLFLVSACPSGDKSSTDDMPVISVTSLGDVQQIETSDVSIQLVGTANAPQKISEVSWKNDRGGNGSASGTENWSIGPIVLQIGRNNVTITAKDDGGNTNSKNIQIDREPGPFAIPTDDGEPIVMYSYNSDRSHSAPLAGAHVDSGPLFVFLRRSRAWQDSELVRIDYDCCSGNGNVDSAFSRPWQVRVDASSSQQGVDRQLAMIANFSDTPLEERTVTFYLTPEGKPENQAPAISGTPAAAATVGVEYSFLPVGIDPDGDTLGFTVRNKPKWASFDPLTGHLKGFPTASDVGIHENVEIAISDGRTTTSLRRFSIKVDAFTNNAVTLRWDAPTERENELPLTNLAGFEIYYSPASGNLGNLERIENPGVLRHTIENLQAGSWKFVIVAYDENGNYSSPSNEVSTTIL